MHAVDHDEEDFAVFESGALMMYVAEKAGRLYPSEWRKRSEVQQWMFFSNAGVGPMQVLTSEFFPRALIRLILTYILLAMIVPCMLGSRTNASLTVYPTSAQRCPLFSAESAGWCINIQM